MTGSIKTDADAVYLHTPLKAHDYLVTMYTCINDREDEASFPFSMALVQYRSKQTDQGRCTNLRNNKYKLPWQGSTQNEYASTNTQWKHASINMYMT